MAQAFLALIPLTTAYAIRVHHVLEVRFVLRRALQYAFARYTLLAVAALPFAALLAHLYGARQRQLDELANDPGFLWLALAVGLAGVLIATRRRVFALLDRRFFREEYDAQRILSALVEKSRRAGSARELAEVINRELDAALHLESVSVYGRDPLSGHFRAPGGGLPPLAPGSAVAVLLGGSPEPLDVDLEDTRSPLRRLPEVEKQWLADLGTLLLVPLLGSEGTLIGFISLGPKKSELPFSRQDRELLGAVAAAGALTLEHRLGRDSASRRTPDGAAPTPTGPGTPSPNLSFAGDEQASDESAAECPRCGLLALPGTPACSRCGVEPRRAALPLVLLGKYAVERRIGAGGMGVVYLAVDLALGRRVAIKTLPRIAPEQAMRLRREARAMVAVSHPNLALIFGAETWHGTPALVFEYLEGGTLGDRLQHGPLPASQVVQLGLAMSDVLDRIHAAGILHRDIKPSNIGYAGDGTPKLLDFGLARIMEDTRRESPSDSGDGGHDTASVLNPTGSERHRRHAGLRFTRGGGGPAAVSGRRPVGAGGHAVRGAGGQEPAVARQPAGDRARRARRRRAAPALDASRPAGRAGQPARRGPGPAPAPAPAERARAARGPAAALSQWPTGSSSKALPSTSAAGGSLASSRSHQVLVHDLLVAQLRRTAPAPRRPGCCGSAATKKACAFSSLAAPPASPARGGHEGPRLVVVGRLDVEQHRAGDAARRVRRTASGGARRSSAPCLASLAGHEAEEPRRLGGVVRLHLVRRTPRSAPGPPPRSGWPGRGRPAATGARSRCRGWLMRSSFGLACTNRSRMRSRGGAPASCRCCTLAHERVVGRRRLGIAVEDAGVAAPARTAAPGPSP